MSEKIINTINECKKACLKSKETMITIQLLEIGLKEKGCNVCTYKECIETHILEERDNIIHSLENIISVLNTSSTDEIKEFLLSNEVTNDNSIQV